MQSIHFKNLMLALLVLALFGISCKKGDSGYVRATFTGIDYTYTMCSGGYFFTIDTTEYRSFDIVENSILTPSTKLPRTYLIQFEKPGGGCYDVVDNLVKITAIKNP